MKKILIMATVVCAAIFSNAAQIDWKLTVGAGYDGFNVYAISGTTSSAVATAFLSTTETDWTDAVAGLTASTISGNTARTSVAGTTFDVAAGDSLVFVIFSDAIKEGTQYWVLNEYSVPGANLYDPPAMGSAAAVKMADLGTAATGTFTSTAVPEPASAMLALAGVAMLIRRRK